MKRVKIKVSTLDQYGFRKGQVHNTINCPTEFSHRFSDAIWIFCELRNEPLRLLEGEYVELN